MHALHTPEIPENASPAGVSRRTFVAGAALVAALPGAAAAAEPADNYDEIVFAIDAVAEAFAEIERIDAKLDREREAAGLCEGSVSLHLKDFALKPDDYIKDRAFLQTQDVHKWFENFRARLTWNVSRGWGEQYERTYFDEREACRRIEERVSRETAFLASDIYGRITAERDAIYAEHERLCRVAAEIPCRSLRDIQAKISFTVDVLLPVGEFEEISVTLLNSMRVENA